MPRPIVFVGGVHGAGKSTLSRYLAEALPASHVTAGGLIREAASPGHVVTVGAQDKAVPDVDANQAVLLRGLVAYQARTIRDARPLLLDGHFTLMNQARVIVPVPAAVFAAIGPVAVVLVEADATVVHERLAARAPEAPSVDVIVRLTEREREQATATAEALKVPIFLLAGDGFVEQEGQRVMVSLRRLVGGVA
jgi:adenylate kinase